MSASYVPASFLPGRNSSITLQNAGNIIMMFQESGDRTYYLHYAKVRSSAPAFHPIRTQRRTLLQKMKEE